MDAILETLRVKSECRTPIVVFRDQRRGASDDSIVQIVKSLAAASDSFLEHVHAGSDDELPTVGKHIDTAIINGDWLLVTCGGRFSTSDFLRFVGRRLFTIMPDNDRRPNMELFRLWLCIDRAVPEPLVFQQVALHLDISPLLDDRPSKAAQSSLAVKEHHDSRDRRTDAPDSSRTQYEQEIPVDESACEHENDFEAAVHKGVLPCAPSAAADAPLVTSKVGSLFHRRLELSAGRRPTSSGSRAAEIRQLRVQSAQLRHSAAAGGARTNTAPNSARQAPPVSLRDGGAVTSAPPPRPPSASAMASSALPSPTAAAAAVSARDHVGASRPPSVCSSSQRSSHVTSAAQSAFESTTSEALQKLYGALMKSYTFSPNAALRLQRWVLNVADSVSAAPTAEHKPESDTSMSSVPVHKMDHFDVGDVLMVEGVATLRRGTWRSLEVLAEQMPAEQYASVWSGLVRIRCSVRHPYVQCPLAVLTDASSPLVYVVYPFPKGPLVSVLRRSAPPSGTLTGSSLVRYALQAVRCCAVALQLLHDSGYVHRDVAAHNVLDSGTDGVFQLKITNRCCPFDPECGASAEHVAARWASPDALFTGRYHCADDVWSLGVLLWEILTLGKEIPYSEYPLKDEVAAALAKGETLAAPREFSTHSVWTKIAQPCFSSRLKRPSLGDIISIADRLLGN